MSFRIVEQLKQRHWSVHLTVSIFLFICIAYLDLVLDRDLSLYAFYLIPALYSTWFLGIWTGGISCAASALVWLIDDWRVAAFYGHTFVAYWNLAMRAIALLFIITIVDLLKASLEEGHWIERQRAHQDLAIAREVQMRLLPATPPPFAGLDLACFYEPSQSVGGDYYDFIPLSTDRLGIAVADVCGRGCPVPFSWPRCRVSCTTTPQRSMETTLLRSWPT